MEEACDKALDKAEARIVTLTMLVPMAKEKAQRAKEATRPQGTHDDEVGPSSCLPLFPPSPHSTTLSSPPS